MRAVDTNVLVRLVTRDDARQVAAAENFVEPGAWVSHLVLAEATWVLTSVYERGPGEIGYEVRETGAVRQGGEPPHRAIYGNEGV